MHPMPEVMHFSFPNSYNIHNYCLGHGDFVTSLGILSDDLVLSGSGDGTVRVWRQAWLNKDLEILTWIQVPGRRWSCKERSVQRCWTRSDWKWETGGSSKSSSSSRAGEEWEKSGGAQPGSCCWCSLLAKQPLPCSGELQGLIFNLYIMWRGLQLDKCAFIFTPVYRYVSQYVSGTRVQIWTDYEYFFQVENFSGLLLYGLNFGMLEGKAGISLKQTISLSSSLLDYDFEPSSETLHILLKNDTSVVVETYKIDCSKLVKDSVHSFSDLKQADFFDAVKDFEKSNLENLHKRWFDNVKDYMEKKESRQEEMKRKEPPSAKKLKPENWYFCEPETHFIELYILSELAVWPQLQCLGCWWGGLVSSLSKGVWEGESNKIFSWTLNSRFHLISCICTALPHGTTCGSQLRMLTLRRRGLLLPRSIPLTHSCQIAPNLGVTVSQLFSRYGMLPEDYKQYDPVEEMDVMAGDYPKLPVKSAMIHLRFAQICLKLMGWTQQLLCKLCRDPFYPWDVPTLRRNFGEPLQVGSMISFENSRLSTPTWFQENWNSYQEDRFTDMDGTARYTRKQMVAAQIAWFGFVIFSMWLCNGEHGIPL